MTGKSDIVDVPCILVTESKSGRAYLIDHGGGSRVWVPKSLCEWDEVDKTMAMPFWIAKDKGLV